MKADVNLNFLLVCLKTDSRRPAGSLPAGQEQTEVVAQKAEEDGDSVFCAACRNKITTAAEKISVHGARQHSFSNPSGLIFEIGCFKQAPGCDHVGEASDEFTWFKGYQWQIAVCRQCRTHLGWLFVTSGSFFHGLIVDKLL